MRRTLVCFGLALLLLFAVGGAALASPPVGAEEGSFVVFLEYASDAYIYENPHDALVVVGYGITDWLTIGGEVQYHESDWVLYGIYAALSFDPVYVNLDLLYNLDGPWCFGKLAGGLRFDLDPFALYAGVGVCYGWDDYWVAIEAGADFAIENLTFYGTIDYAPSKEYTTFKVGMSLAF